MKTSNLTNYQFDPDNTNTFDPDDPNNIAYVLNTTFLNSLPAAAQALIIPHNWTIDPEIAADTGSNPGYRKIVTIGVADTITTIAASDIAAVDAAATVTLYSDFSTTPVASVSLTGGENHIYIKVEKDSTTLYYEVVVFRTASPPGNAGLATVFRQAIAVKNELMDAIRCIKLLLNLL